MLSFKDYIMEENPELLDIGFQLLEELINENYEFTNEETELSEDSEIIFNIILEHFIENYNDTLEESENDKNAELVEEIYDIILDESIGSAIASIVHGAGGERRAYTKAKLKPELMRIKAQANPKLISNTGIPVYKEKAKEHAEKIQRGDYGKGISGAIKKKFGERDVAKSQKKYEKMESNIRLAKDKIGIAGVKLRQKERSQGRLAYKIDRAIRPANVARAAIKGTLKGIAWATRKIMGKPKRSPYRYQYRRRYH